MERLSIAKPKGHGAADLHIHSAVGDGMATIPEILDHVQCHTGLDIIAITDHDEIEGSYQARELVTKGNYRFQVVVGMEVTTLEGHLLALFLESPVPSLQPLIKTIKAIHSQGGLCIIPHPMSWLTRSIGQGSMEKILSYGDGEVYFDGIEMVNPTIAARVSAEKAKLLNERRYRLAETGGSDAHFLAKIGGAYTLFPGQTAEDLYRSLRERTTRAAMDSLPRQDQIVYNKVVQQQFRSLVILPSRLLRKTFQRLMKG